MKKHEKIKESIIDYGNEIINKPLPFMKAINEINKIEEIISLLYTFKHSLQKKINPKGK